MVVQVAVAIVPGASRVHESTYWASGQDCRSASEQCGTHLPSLCACDTSIQFAFGQLQQVSADGQIRKPWGFSVRSWKALGWWYPIFIFLNVFLRGWLNQQPGIYFLTATSLCRSSWTTMKMEVWNPQWWQWWLARIGFWHTILYIYMTIQILYKYSCKYMT